MPADKFIKNTIYIVLAILLISFLLVQPYNLICRIKHSCHPITFKSLLLHKSGIEKIVINFASEISSDLKNIIEFKPEKSAFEAVNGKIIHNNFIVKNLTDKNITITSHFKVEPEEIGKYLERIQCLCFQNQPVNSNQQVSMPVSFRINPDIEKDQNFKDLKEILISYEAYLVE